MLESYIPILFFVILGLMFGVIPITMSSLVATQKPSPAKNEPYECGFEPFGFARMKFDVRFYLVAILFIIFDLEIAFLFPWALVFQTLGWSAFVAMGIFLLLLTVGFIYEWKKGALEWE